MYRILKNEFLKLRKTKLLLISLCGAIVAPIIVFSLASIISSSVNNYSVTFLEFISIVLQITVRISSIIFYPYVVGEFISREFRNDTFKSQIAIPIDRTDFLFGKILLATIWVVFMVIITFLFSVFFSFILEPKGVRMLLISKSLFIYFKTAFLVLPFSYFTIGLTLVYKQIFKPMIINFIILILIFILEKLDGFSLIPWLSVNEILFARVIDGNIDINVLPNYISLMLLASGSILFAYKKINTIEI